MWNINISMEDAAKMSGLLESYEKSIPQDSAEMKRVETLKTKLDQMLKLVQQENKVVSDYIESIKNAQLAQGRKVV